MLPLPAPTLACAWLPLLISLQQTCQKSLRDWSSCLCCCALNVSTQNCHQNNSVNYENSENLKSQKTILDHTAGHPLVPKIMFRTTYLFFATLACFVHGILCATRAAISVSEATGDLLVNPVSMPDVGVRFLCNHGNPCQLASTDTDKQVLSSPRRPRAAPPIGTPPVPTGCCRAS